jgi:hypothetical protein
VFKVVEEVILANEYPPPDPGRPQVGTVNFPPQGIDRYNGAAFGKGVSGGRQREEARQIRGHYCASSLASACLPSSCACRRISLGKSPPTSSSTSPRARSNQA